MQLIDLPPDPRGGQLRRKYERQLRERVGIDPALIAAELGLKERTVVRLQVKLGLRGCRNHVNKGPVALLTPS
jgi:hypothetical protein